jgi:predicted metal-dependent phosphoesterase TrpH
MTLKIDFHVHTKYSVDSIIEPKALVAKSRKLGIIPAIADHNSTEAHAAMRALKADFIPAEEIFTDRGDLIGLYVSETIPRKTPFLEAVDLIHGQGGLAYLPHMYDYGRSKAHAEEKEAAKVDIIEVFNARCLRKEYNERAAAFAKSHHLPGAAGSDSHFLMEFGSTWTELPDFDLDSPKALLKALKTQNSKPGTWKLVTRRAPLYVRGTTTFIAIGRKLVGRLRL